MTILVTGGTGFIGAHIAERLCRDGHRVRVLDNFSTGHRRNLREIEQDIEIIEGDIQSYERVATAVRGCEIVLHQAALPSVPRSVQDPLTSNASNVIGTLNVLLAARDAGVRRVVAASSSSVYGSNPTLPKHEALDTRPISPYAVAKLAGEGYCRSFSEVYGIETVALRYFNVFGPRQDPLSHYAAAVPKFIMAILAGRAPTVHGDGEQSRDFTYVSNVVDANLLAMDAPGVSGKAYNVACGERITLNRLLEELGTLTGRRVEAHYTAPRAGDVRDSLADLTNARADLGYEPAVGFEEALALTLAYYEREIEELPAAGAARLAVA
jgi:UDP-glucose 4-epimerase